VYVCVCVCFAFKVFEPHEQMARNLD